MKCWICLPEQLNEWYQTITPVEFHKILKSDILPLYNYVGAPREWHIRQLPGKHSFLYTSIAIAHACYFSTYKQLMAGDDERIYYTTLDILASIDSKAYHHICAGQFNLNFPEQTVSLFADNYEEFKENIQNAFLWAEGTYLNTIDIKYFIEAYMLQRTNENTFKKMAGQMYGATNGNGSENKQYKYDINGLTAKEKRELGSLRNEKMKFLRSIEVATAIGPIVDEYVKTENRPITRKIFHDLLRDHSFFDIPFTTIDKIWKSLPEKCRHKGGRPAGENDS